MSSHLLLEFRSLLLPSITNIGTNRSTIKLLDSDSEANYTNGKITFSNWSLELPEGKTAADLFTKITGKDENDDPIFEVVTGNQVFLDAVADGTEGANVSVFGWTLAKAQGAF